ncbi:MAG: hypothetical protein KKF48_01915 [Nanoarchaeota archaeon]|nr:hypothetical protein [Nanoarchaeota archaeon]MBU1027776.1 hypothetical protein [Nanoarchaeota archaeon]
MAKIIKILSINNSTLSEADEIIIPMEKGIMKRCPDKKEYINYNLNVVKMNNNNRFYIQGKKKK